MLYPTLTNRGTYGGDVIALQVKDDFLYSLDAFFCSEVHLVVFAANVSCNLTNANKLTKNTAKSSCFFPQDQALTLHIIDCTKKVVR